MTVGELFQKLEGVDPSSEVFVTPVEDGLVPQFGTVAVLFDDNFDVVEVLS